MQIKKDYTREHILNVSKQIFRCEGFAKTSMRDIAKRAGIGVSNIYNYFKSKDELFCCIVAPLISELESMMREHHTVKEQETFLSCVTGEGNAIIANNVKEYMRLINNHRDELKLLLYQSQGSSLENYIDTYTEECSKMILAFMNEAKRIHPDLSTIHTPFTYHVHMVWMFNFISEVIKHNLPADEIKRAIEDYIVFEFAGWQALMRKD